MTDFKAIWMHWSTWLWGAAVTLLGVVELLPDWFGQLVGLTGGELPFLSADRVRQVSLALGAAGLIAKGIRQTWVKEKIKSLWAWFLYLLADKAGTAVRKAALLGGAAGCVMSMSAWGYGQYERLEGNRLVAYADPATKGEPWTICAGATGKIYYDGKVVRVRKGLVLTAAQCRQVTDHILEATRAGLNRCVTQPLNQAQSIGLTIFAANVGVGGACNGSVVRYVNAGDFAAAERVMWLYSCAPSTNPKYPHAHCGPVKRQMPGLLSRRQFEGELMTAGDLFNRSPADLMAIANHKALAGVQ